MNKGFTYIEMCIVLTLFSMVITPFGMMHLVNVKTRVAIDKIERRTQTFETLSTEIKKEQNISDDFFNEQTKLINIDENKTEPYNYKVTLYDLKEVPSSILPANLLQLLRNNVEFHLSDATLTITSEGTIDSQTYQAVTIWGGKIKVRENVVGTYVTVAKGDTSFNLKDNAKEFFVVTLVVNDIQSPFTIKISNATGKPLFIQLQEDNTNIHFILDDPNNQILFVQDNQSAVDYKIAQIQIQEKQNPTKQVTQTVFFKAKAFE